MQRRLSLRNRVEVWTCRFPGQGPVALVQIIRRAASLGRQRPRAATEEGRGGLAVEREDKTGCCGQSHGDSSVLLPSHQSSNHNNVTMSMEQCLRDNTWLLCCACLITTQCQRHDYAMPMACALRCVPAPEARPRLTA